MTTRITGPTRRVTTALKRVLSPVTGWLIDHGVNLIAFIAVCFLIVSTIMGTMDNPP